jgi:hypothetical protein
MRNTLKIGALAAAAIAAAMTVASPAMARPWHRHHHGHFGVGPAIGFAAGALIGGALARPYYYSGGPYYAYQPAYRTDGAVQYCMQRFKSYDPARGTYLGYDGVRHPCP